MLSRLSQKFNCSIIPVILNNVKNLNTFIVCLQILRCSQNDKVKK